MKLEHRRLLVTGFLASGLLALACASGETVGPPPGGGTGGDSGGVGTGGTPGAGVGGHVGTGGTPGAGVGGHVGTGGTPGTGVGGHVGTGGTTTTPGTGGATTTPGTGGMTSSGAAPCTVASTDAVIDAVEAAGNGFNHACVHGYWYTYNDGSAGTQTPTGTWTNVTLPAGTTGDFAGSTYAVHSTATGFTGDTATPKNIFAGFGLDLNPNSTGTSPKKFTVNASAFSGISFYAKGPGAISVQLSTPMSDPDLGCTTKCYDTNTDVVTLTSSWAQYKLPWASFVQASPPFGTPETLNGSDIGTLKFVSQATGPAAFVPYDVWVDEVALY